MSTAAPSAERRQPVLDRRTVIVGAAAVVVASANGGSATPADMEAAMRVALGAGPIGRGRVHVELPVLAENGNAVPLEIRIASPMTAADHVRSVYVFSPENPLPNISRFHLGPRAGKAEIKTSIRLATTQVVHVVAVMSDSSRWLGTAEVDVTTAACFDPT